MRPCCSWVHRRPGGNRQCGEWQAKQEHHVEAEKVVAIVMEAQVREDSGLAKPAVTGGQKEVDR